MNYIKNSYLAILAVFVFFLASSCRTKKEVIYFQVPPDTLSKSDVQPKSTQSNDTITLQAYEPVIKHNDWLDIYVSSINPDAASFFNPFTSRGNTNASRSNPEIIGYLVDVNGEIELPLLGAVKVEGLTVPMIKDTLKKKLEKYLESPSVRVVFVNFKVSVLGEVNAPGIYTVQNERITFLEAIALAGDLTIFGNRKNVMVIREENGKKEFAYLDITKRDFFQSRYFFLHPNDVIYVEPAEAKVLSGDAFFKWYSFTLTTITFMLTLSILLKK